MVSPDPVVPRHRLAGLLVLVSLLARRVLLGEDDGLRCLGRLIRAVGAHELLAAVRELAGAAVDADGVLVPRRDLEFADLGLRDPPTEPGVLHVRAPVVKPDVEAA